MRYHATTHHPCIPLFLLFGQSPRYLLLLSQLFLFLFNRRAIVDVFLSSCDLGIDVPSLFAFFFNYLRSTQCSAPPAFLFILVNCNKSTPLRASRSCQMSLILPSTSTNKWNKKCVKGIWKWKNWGQSSARGFSLGTSDSKNAESGSNLSLPSYIVA